MTWRLIAIVVLGVGCGAQLGDGVGELSSDAGTGNGGGGGGGGNGGGSGSGNGSGNGGAKMDAGVPLCANNRKVFLEFEGVTITKAATSDSTQNRASWITNNSAAIPPWRQGSSTRTADIATVVAGVKSRLATTPFEIVTTRPASGPYVMVVFGGRNTDNGGTVGTPYSYATNEHDCGDLVKNDIAWVSDEPTVSYTQDLAVGAIGWGLGLNGTNSPADCMCGWANDCESASGACTLSASIATTTSQSPATTCPNQNPQNEVAAFSTKFCQ